MKKIELMKFCRPNDIRYYLHAPSLLDQEHMIASNGHILIVGPIDPMIERYDGDELVLRSIGLRDNFYDLQSEMDFHPVASIVIPTPKRCKVCTDGYLYECATCLGEGEASEGADKPCITCGGAGYSTEDIGRKIVCHNCEGTAQDPYQTVQFGDTHFARRYIAMLQTIDGCELAASPINPKTKTGYFRFEGGFGALMPCNP